MLGLRGLGPLEVHPALAAPCCGKEAHSQSVRSQAADDGHPKGEKHSQIWNNVYHFLFQPSSVIEKKKKKVAKSPPKKNVNLSLAVKLETSGQPALGLEHITEFLHPEKLEKNYPMYSCSLEGCKSAWGTSFEIFHHVLNAKHQKNFLKSINPNDATIGDMPKSDILLKV